MLKKGKNKLLLFFIIISSFYSCGENYFFEKFKSIPSAEWHKDSVVNFSFIIEDTLVFHDFYLNVRNNNDYPYSNFYVFMTITFPNNKTAKDTFNLPMADVNGKWLGSGIGSLKTHRFLFKKKLRFPLKGQYDFTLKQGMRKENLIGIEDVGLQIQIID